MRVKQKEMQHLTQTKSPVCFNMPTKHSAFVVAIVGQWQLSLVWAGNGRSAAGYSNEGEAHRKVLPLKTTLMNDF